MAAPGEAAEAARATSGGGSPPTDATAEKGEGTREEEDKAMARSELKAKLKAEQKAELTELKMPLETAPVATPPSSKAAAAEASVAVASTVEGSQQTVSPAVAVPTVPKGRAAEANRRSTVTKDDSAAPGQHKFTAGGAHGSSVGLGPVGVDSDKDLPANLVAPTSTPEPAQALAQAIPAAIDAAQPQAAPVKAKLTTAPGAARGKGSAPAEILAGEILAEAEVPAARAKTI